jgi:hypothetical protein
MTPREEEPMKTTKTGYKLRSGRRILGTIEPGDTGFAWTSNFTGHRGVAMDLEGVSSDLDTAIRALCRTAGMSPRQYEIDLVDATGQRTRIDR